MKSQTYIFLYSLNVSHCSKASHYKITHLQMVQGLLFSFGISNRNKSAHSSRHSFSSICVRLCMARTRGTLPRKTLHHRSCLDRWVVEAAHQRAAAKETPGSGCGCCCFRISRRTSLTTGWSPSGEAPKEGTSGGFAEEGQHTPMHDISRSHVSILPLSSPRPVPTPLTWSTATAS